MHTNRFNELTRFISPARLSTYYAAIQTQDLHFAIEHYVYNAKLSENFYFLLQNLEVALRNAIYSAYCSHFSEPFFFLHETDSRNRYKEKKEFHSRECWKMLCGARYQLLKRSESVNDGKLIAELNFGFWSKLINSNHPKYKTMWYRIFNDVFAHFPQQHSIDQELSLIDTKIDAIRKFRNRVFHYEPIFNHGNLYDAHDSIIQVLGWLSPELQKLSLAFDEFENILHAKRKINKKFNTLYPSSPKRRFRSKGKRS